MDNNKMRKKSSLSPINTPNNILFDAIVSNFNSVLGLGRVYECFHGAVYTKNSRSLNTSQILTWSVSCREEFTFQITFIFFSRVNSSLF